MGPRILIGIPNAISFNFMMCFYVKIIVKYAKVISIEMVKVDKMILFCIFFLGSYCNLHSI